MRPSTAQLAWHGRAKRFCANETWPHCHPMLTSMVVVLSLCLGWPSLHPFNSEGESGAVEPSSQAYYIDVDRFAYSCASCQEEQGFNHYLPYVPANLSSFRLGERSAAYIYIPMPTRHTFGLLNRSPTPSSLFVSTRYQFEEQRIEQWQMEWAEKAEVRAVAHRKMLEAVLANPDNEPERALQKKLKVSGGL